MTPDPVVLPRLTVNRADAESQLKDRVAEGRTIAERSLATRADLDAARIAQTQWQRYNADLLRSLFGGDEVLNGLFGTWGAALTMPRPLPDAFAAFRRDVERQVADIEGVILRLKLYPEPSGAQPSPKPALDVLDTLKRLCDRFALVAAQLRARHDSRPTIAVEDEYDVQDLMHSLLHLHFDDIRPEEYTPSYAAKSTRMDFLLREHSVVVETKMARPGLDAKRLGSELIDDIARYRSHPSCKTLVCFVYDPDRSIVNPRGLEHDLEAQPAPPVVRVFIRPLGH